MPAPRYGAVAVLLHWAIAAAIVANLALGWWMHDAIEEAGTQARAIAAFQLHKSLGLTILGLSLLRLAWRLLHRAPPYPAAMPRWERAAAHAVHWALYGVMIAVPLSGWLYVSTQWRGPAPLNVPTLWFGLFEVPHLLGLDELAAESRRALSATLYDAHAFLVRATAALLLHVGAALKHQFVDRDEVMAGMLPLLAPRGASTPGRRTLLAAGTALILLATAAFAAAVLQVPGAGGQVLADQGVVGATPSGSDKPFTGAWSVLPEASEIAFTGTHAGVAFRGRFTRWSADLRFDPAHPEQASIVATVETGSATDGVPLHDETLPEPEWFDVKRHPSATFRSSAIRPLADNAYELQGTLTIKNRPLQIGPLAMRLERGLLRIEGNLTVRRADADLGMESDPAGEYVSTDIGVQVNVVAEPR